MKLVIINKSDSTGGAAVVSRRLMEALRQENVEARMIVCEKLTDSPFIETASIPRKIKWTFLKERLKIFIANGFNRSTLFKIDTGEEGLPLWRHPWVKEADAILINWVNQGMLSLKGFKKILETGKPVVWTMHDMWEMTGICHHAGECNNFKAECGSCKFLGKQKSPKDLSYRIWKRKETIYYDEKLTKRLAFVAVSNWLKEKANQSSLLKDKRVEVIPNAFECGGWSEPVKKLSQTPNKIRILFGAARLDDPIKGLDTLKQAAEVIKKRYPHEARRLEIAMFGSIKNPEILKGFALPIVNLGVLKGEDEVRDAYMQANIVVSASSYETLPGTLVEAQAYGCIPVSFNRGGQADIIENYKTGFLIEYSEEMSTRALDLAQGIMEAVRIINDEDRHSLFIREMKESVENKFSYNKVTQRYINLIKEL